MKRNLQDDSKNKKRKIEYILPKDIWNLILILVWSADNHCKLTRICKLFLSILSSAQFYKQIKIPNYFPCLSVMQFFPFSPDAKTAYLNTLEKLNKIGSTNSAYSPRLALHRPSAFSHPGAQEKLNKIGDFYLCNGRQKNWCLAGFLIHYHLGAYNKFYYQKFLSCFSYNQNLTWELLIDDNFQLLWGKLKLDDISLCPPEYKDKVLDLSKINMNINNYNLLPLFPSLIQKYYWERNPVFHLINLMNLSESNNYVEQIIVLCLKHNRREKEFLFLIKPYMSFNLLDYFVEQLTEKDYLNPAVLSVLFSFRERQDRVELFYKIKDKLNLEVIQHLILIPDFVRLTLAKKWQDLLPAVTTLDVEDILSHRTVNLENYICITGIIYELLKFNLMDKARYIIEKINYKLNFSYFITIANLIIFYLNHPDKIIINKEVPALDRKQSLIIIRILRKKDNLIEYKWLASGINYIFVKRIMKCINRKECIENDSWIKNRLNLILVMLQGSKCISDIEVEINCKYCQKLFAKYG